MSKDRDRADVSACHSARGSGMYISQDSYKVGAT